MAIKVGCIGWVSASPIHFLIIFASSSLISISPHLHFCRTVVYSCGSVSSVAPAERGFTWVHLESLKAHFRNFRKMSDTGQVAALYSISYMGHGGTSPPFLIRRKPSPPISQPHPRILHSEFACWLLFLAKRNKEWNCFKLHFLVLKVSLWVYLGTVAFFY